MVSIRIFDLQKVGLGHELQRCQLHHWMAICMTQNLLKKCESILNRFVTGYKFKTMTIVSGANYTAAELHLLVA